ncbi:MAG: c-type cytochrome [Alphaproteobacteria bacterium]
MTIPAVGGRPEFVPARSVVTAHESVRAPSRARGGLPARCRAMVFVATIASVLAIEGATGDACAQIGAIAPGTSGAEPAPVPASGGEVLYLRYCASCHGATGHGDGPVAADLRVPPPDLTLIAKRDGGRFDERRLVAVIDGRRAVAAHGSRAMPVWGEVFDAELAGAPHARRQNLLRSTTLVDWLRSIQVR